MTEEQVVNIIAQKIKEIKDEFDGRTKDGTGYYEYAGEYAHIEDVLKELIDEITDNWRD